MLASRRRSGGCGASGERQVAVDGGDYYYQLEEKGIPIEIVYPRRASRS